MSKRQGTMTEEKEVSDVGRMVEEEDQEPPPETRRTRSGRKVRTPAALLDSETPSRTRRQTRRTVLQELPAVEEKNTEQAARIPESVAEETPVVCEDPEPCPVPEPLVPHTEEAAADTHTDTARVDVNGVTDMKLCGPAAVETGPKSSETIPKKKPRLASGGPGTQNPVIPLGKPKSGRVWKNRNKLRFSAVVRDKSVCSSWEKKMEAKRDKEQVKLYTQQLKGEKAKQKEDKRKRREDNLKRRAENERKSEIVQVIRNTSKIKRMKKKQLRKIEKRDTLAILQKSQKQAEKAVKGLKSTKVEQVST